jgi:hypothetical protein
MNQPTNAKGDLCESQRLAELITGMCDPLCMSGELGRQQSPRCPHSYLLFAQPASFRGETQEQTQEDVCGKQDTPNLYDIGA